MSAGNLTLTVAQFRALGTGVLPASATVTLADTGVAIASLSVGEMASLAGKGIDRRDASDNQLALSVAQYGSDVSSERRLANHPKCEADRAP